MRHLNNRFVNVKRERTNTVLNLRYLNNTSVGPVPPYTPLVVTGRNVVKRDRNNTTINVQRLIVRGGKGSVTGTNPVYRCFKVKRDLDLHDSTINRLLIGGVPVPVV